MKDLTDKQGGLDGKIGILLRPATRTGPGGMPCGERLLRKPDRDIATLTQGLVVFGPVRHFITQFFNLVTAALILFIRPRPFFKVKSVQIMPDQARSARPQA